MLFQLVETMENVERVKEIYKNVLSKSLLAVYPLVGGGCVFLEYSVGEVDERGFSMPMVDKNEMTKSVFGECEYLKVDKNNTGRPLRITTYIEDKDIGHLVVYEFGGWQVAR